MCCKRLFQVCTVRADFAGAVEHKHSHICLSDIADGQGAVGNGLSFAGNSVHISAVGQVAEGGRRRKWQRRRGCPHR